MIQLFCSFCGRSKDEVAKLIAGPRAYVCNECVAGVSKVAELSARGTCSFCGQTDHPISLSAKETRMCVACIELCEEILDEGVEERRRKARELADKYSIPWVDLRAKLIAPETLARVPRDFAVAHNLIPIECVPPFLIVVLADPTQLDAIRELERVTGLRVQLAIAPTEVIERAISERYSA